METQVSARTQMTASRRVTLVGYALFVLSLVLSILYLGPTLRSLQLPVSALPPQLPSGARADAGNLNINITMNMNINLKSDNKTTQARVELPLQLPSNEAGAGAVNLYIGAININMKAPDTGAATKTARETETKTETKTETETKAVAWTEREPRNAPTLTTTTAPVGTVTAAPPALLRPPFTGGGHEVSPTPTTMSLLSSFKTCGRCLADGTADFVRVGEQRGDGGYVLCKSALAGARGVISIGIRGHDHMSTQLAETLGIPVHTFDCTSGPSDCPTHYRNCHLVRHHRRCIGSGFNLTTTTLSALVRRYFPGDRRDLILKIDCEGCEWQALVDAGARTLARFLTVAIEWHNLHKPGVGEQALMLRAQQEVLKTFRVVHTHGCNCLGHVFVQDQGVYHWMPYTVEGLLVPKELSLPLSPCLQTEYLPAVDWPVCPGPDYLANTFHLP